MAYSSGKCAVITGAASGIGRALAKQLNSEGCELYLSDINATGLQETVDQLPRADIPCDQQLLDVADRAAMHAWAERIADARGKVDIVINNAGVGLGDRVEEMNYENLDWLMGINFWGVIQGSMAFLPLLKRAEQGHLVNISSLFGIIAVPTQSAYNAAKFGVRGFTESLRQEMKGTNVHVCCVHPGGIATNIARNSRGGDLGASADDRDARFQKFARTTAESAAAQIINAVEKRKPRLLIGLDAKIASFLSRIFPVRYPEILRLQSVVEPDSGS
ncbi:SDR family NAD(P)-dependent oxidoreductase [Pseudohalioglobus sediminis]|uniref:SDR family NAD(P)-dependent oxidoreductase n=1 Tax=Pseudohalioglobus sediminis TaxID=2606449 RepID=A0A5B0WUA3_9GAMM|nr:SDR family NAD(P)-dependent oxidoreductase [Pseudohalioglobus sediminis]KAA1190048.1 SDR family NAD(P)-dependent oxidoreductase [Pseudohalioglobus sediminis]